MIIAIHHHSQTPPDSFSWKWAEQLRLKNIEVRLLDFRLPESFDRIQGCDAAMWHWYHTPGDKRLAPRILSAIELGLHLPVFPNAHTCWHYDEKLSQHYLLEALRVPKIKTWIFWNRQEALNFAKQCAYPVVFKLSSGAGSANVLKIENSRHAISLIDQMFGTGIVPYSLDASGKMEDRDSFKWFGLKHRPDPVDSGEWGNMTQQGYAYFQEFLHNNSHDIRITVIGNRAFGFLRHNREGDFRASGSGRIECDPAKIPLQAISLAFQVSKQCRFQSMAYDFLRDSGGKLRLGEISYGFVNQAVYDCPGYWDDNLVFHSRRVWPEEAHVEDFLASLAPSSTTCD